MMALEWIGERFKATVTQLDMDLAGWTLVNDALYEEEILLAFTTRRRMILSFLWFVFPRSVTFTSFGITANMVELHCSPS